jgi:O-antigen ligase
MNETALNMRVSRQQAALVYAAGFLYTLSLHKYVVRDPLATGSGVQGLLEFGFIMSALACAFVALRKSEQRFAASPAMICLALFGFFALASSWRSFNPPLSLAKGMLFFAVLGMGYMAGQAGYMSRLFQAIYWAFTSTIAVGILVGLALPGRFPLWTTDEFTGRSRFSVFGTFPGTMGETASYLILLSPLFFRRSHWVSRLFLLVANILAGGKTSTAILLALLAIEYVLKIRSARSWRTVAMVTALTCGFAVVAYQSLVQEIDPATAAGTKLEGVYGHDVAGEAMSLDGRLDLWKGSFAVMVANPVLGYGIDGARDVMFKLASWSGSTHNGFLDLGIDGGILSVCFFFVGLMYVLRACLDAVPGVRSQLLMVFTYMFVIAWTGITFSFPSFFGVLVLVFLLFRSLESRAEARARKLEHREPMELSYSA